MKKMGWEGAGLGAEEQGIQEPVKGGEVRDKVDKYKVRCHCETEGTVTPHPLQYRLTCVKRLWYIELLYAVGGGGGFGKVLGQFL